MTAAVLPESPISVLLVEDDERLAKVTQRYLEGTGFKVSWAATSSAALMEGRAQQHDVILLDLNLPGRDGIDLCREFRSHSSIPIIIVTARRDESDHVLGFDAGADDYVVKPFSSRALVSRIRAVVRRARGLVGPRQVLRAGDIEIDLASLAVTVAGQLVTLTSYEFALLRVLAERAGRVLSREQLLELSRGEAGLEESFDRSIDVQISKLRQKLGDDARTPRYLKTVRGYGYVLAAS